MAYFTPVQLTQDCQHTPVKIVSPLRRAKRFVNEPVVLVQVDPAVRFSCPLQPSRVNLYSTESAVNGSVVVHTESFSGSVSGLQLPHQLFQVPFTKTPV